MLNKDKRAGAQLAGLRLSRLINGSFIFSFDKFLLQTMKVGNVLPHGAKCAHQGETLRGWEWRGSVNSAAALLLPGSHAEPHPDHQQQLKATGSSLGRQEESLLSVLC